MKVIYYTYLCFLDEALSYVKSLSKLVELHLLIQISPSSWQNAFFDVPPQDISAGIIDGEKVFNLLFPKKMQRYWQNCASFNLVVYDNPRDLHHSSLKIGHKTIKFFQKIYVMKIKMVCGGGNSIFYKN